MARSRARAAVRKAALQARDRARSVYEPNVIAEGVRAVAVDLEPVVTDGSLYWVAPFRYVAEQMAPRVCRHAGLDPGRAVEVCEYLIAAWHEFVVSIVERFDVEHFEAWTAAARGEVPRE